MFLDPIQPRKVEQPLRELLRNFTYRPGWHFSVIEGSLRVNATVIDANNQTQNIPLTFSQAIPPYLPADFDWTRWLFEQILKLERHEAQEFFQLNGKQVYDPHLEGTS